MKVTLYVDSGANIHSRKEMTFDLDTESGRTKFGYSKEEWISFTDDEKYKVAKEWADNYLDIGYEELT